MGFREWTAGSACAVTFCQARGGDHDNGESSRTSIPRGIPLTAGLEQEPGAPLGFVDPDFDQARGSDVAMLFGYVMGLA